MTRFLFFGLFFLFINSLLWSQNEIKFKSSAGSLISNIEKLEKISCQRIFHNIQTDEKISNGKSYSDKTLEEILGDLLSETVYGYINYRDYGIIIVNQVIIDQDYDTKYYERLSGNHKSNAKTAVIGDVALLDASGTAIVSGKIVDAQTNEEIVGATIKSMASGQGTITDIDGKYELTLEAGEQIIEVEFIGYEKWSRKYDVRSSAELRIKLDKGAIQLEEITISASGAQAKLQSAQIGVQSLDMATVKKLPTFMGEVDIVQSFILQPGVSSIGEGAAGFNVRGGEVDQNLIKQDETILFNSSHALGFFSTFNSDLISKVDLYKANMPASLGGRLASVMDVQMRDGNMQQFKIKGGIGPISSKISLEGPIIKDKVSLLVGGRSSYSDWVLQRMQQRELQRSSSFFYDANARLTIEPNANNSLTFSAYKSKDEFVYNEEFGFDYETESAEASYGLIINKNILSKLTAVISTYNSAQLDLVGVDAARVSTGVEYMKIKENITYTPIEEVELNIGGSWIDYKVNPGALVPLDISEFESETLEEENGREMAGHASLRISPLERIEIIGGIRYVRYQFLGPKTVFSYANPQRPRTEEITGASTLTGEIMSDSNLEPRASLRLSLTDHIAVKGGYSRTSQYINQIFNTSTPTPTSQWQLSNSYVKPFRANNYSAGIFANFSNNNWETFIEVFDRDIYQLFDYVDFADLLVNEHIETELVYGIGRARGAELSIRRNTGKANGWLSYTYSKSERQLDEINDGDWYPSNYDKTHDISLLLNYNPNQRNTLTVNFNYSTGRPITAPIGTFIGLNNRNTLIYSDRNSVRIPDYVRMDVSYTLGKGYRVDKKFQTSWTISVYNVMGRKNPYSVFFTPDTQDRVTANKFSVLGNAFPSITINFELL